MSQQPKAPQKVMWHKEVAYRVLLIKLGEMSLSKINDSLVPQWMAATNHSFQDIRRFYEFVVSEANPNIEVPSLQGKRMAIDLAHQIAWLIALSRFKNKIEPISKRDLYHIAAQIGADGNSVIQAYAMLIQETFESWKK